MQRTQCFKNAQRSLIIAAAVSSIASTVWAGVDVSGSASGTVYTISTTGATALSKFSSAEGTKGPYLVGSTNVAGGYQLGDTIYTIDTASGQPMGRLISGTVDSGIVNNADRLVYVFHSTGSVAGINDLVNAQIGAGFTATISSSNPIYVQGVANTSGDLTGISNGYNLFSTAANRPAPVIAFSDVRADQAFSVGSTANASYIRRPTENGYGKGRQGALNTFTNNRQTLTAADTGTLGSNGGIAPTTTRLRNESLAVVPFTVSANPGTGLTKLSEDDVKFLNVAGRLANGANFNFTTRDVGSGTRNQAGNNVSLDPTWTSGERDRASLTDTIVGSGSSASTSIGSEQRRDNSIFNGATGGTALNNEHRPSAIARFADKSSGSEALRTVLRSNRMSLGVLSVGDVGSDGKTGSAATSAAPLRVLAIDWNENGSEPVASFVQPTAENVTEGRYHMWSASQAVTITPDSTNVNNAGSAIKGDTIDYTGSGGIHRNFINNITNSIASGPNPATLATPFDAVIDAGFIPLQIMNVTKVYDGDTMTTGTRSSATDSDPLTFTPQEIWNATVQQSNGKLKAATDWAAPALMNGNIAGQKYRIFDVNNTGETKAVVSGDVEITFSGSTIASGANAGQLAAGGTFLAGDYSQDGVRDLGDIESMAQAYADTANYLTAHPSVTGTLSTTTSALNTSDVNTAGKAGLLVLSDLNGDGNVAVVGTGGIKRLPNAINAANKTQIDAFTAALGTAQGNDQLEAISKDDVKFFLYGASVDTSAFDTGATAEDKMINRRENGVRLGQLKKNQAVERFNKSVTDLGSPLLKFDRFDVNNDNVLGRLDAKLVNDNVGKRFTNMVDTLSTSADLIAVELTDSQDGLISHVAAVEANDIYGTGGYAFGAYAADKSTSDMKEIVDYLIGKNAFRGGDANFDGVVNVGDFSILSSGWQLAATKYSQGDFNFDGFVNVGDFSVLSSSWQLTYGDMPTVDLLLDAGFNTETASFLVSAVPEPTSLMLLALFGMFARRRRVAR